MNEKGEGRREKGEGRREIIMGGDRVGKNNWVIKEDSNDSSSIGLNSESEMSEDASSCSSTHSNGHLFELSELMKHLPIKRGLSMFYQGKAQSFTSLARVESIQDLPKKATATPYPYSKRMKSCKSFGDSHRILCSPRPTISKKASRGSFASLLSKRPTFLGGSSTPSIAVHKNF